MKRHPKIENAFRDRTVIVTGAASGIGREVVRVLLGCGARVHAFDINGGLLETLEKETSGPGTLTTRTLDVTDGETTRRVFQEVERTEKGVDFLFNNAGITLLGESHKLPFERWKSLLDVNLMGVIHGVQAIYPLMIARGSGHIVNTASVAGVTGYATSAAYAASKAAVIELSRTLRSEAEGMGVRISVVCPGYVDSSIFSQDKIVGVDRERIVGNLPVAMLPPETAARMLLEGVAAGRKTIIFPTTAKIFCFIGNWFPSLLAPYQRNLIRIFQPKS